MNTLIPMKLSLSSKFKWTQSSFEWVTMSSPIIEVDNLDIDVAFEIKKSGDLVFLIVNWKYQNEFWLMHNNENDSNYIFQAALISYREKLLLTILQFPNNPIIEPYILYILVKNRFWYWNENNSQWVFSWEFQVIDFNNFAKNWSIKITKETLNAITEWINIKWISWTCRGEIIS